MRGASILSLEVLTADLVNRIATVSLVELVRGVLIVPRTSQCSSGRTFTQERTTTVPSQEKNHNDHTTLKPQCQSSYRCQTSALCFLSLNIVELARSSEIDSGRPSLLAASLKWLSLHSIDTFEPLAER